MTSENQPVRAGKFSRKDVSYALYVNNNHEKTQQRDRWNKFVVMDSSTLWVFLRYLSLNFPLKLTSFKLIDSFSGQNSCSTFQETCNFEADARRIKISLILHYLFFLSFLPPLIFCYYSQKHYLYHCSLHKVVNHLMIGLRFWWTS